MGQSLLRRAPETSGIEVAEVGLKEFARQLPRLVAVEESIYGEESGALERVILERVPAIGDELLSQLLEVEPSRDGPARVPPLQNPSADGSVLDRVLMVEAEAYIRVWGRWPQLGTAKGFVSIARYSVPGGSPRTGLSGTSTGGP